MISTLDHCRSLSLLLALAAGCADEAVVATPTDAGASPEAASVRVIRWVGAIEETDVSVAAIVGAGKARLYFCGGADSYLTATRWFELQFNGEHLEFQDDSWRIHAHLTAGGVLGEVERTGDGVRMFNARAFEPTTIAGLYEGKADCGHLGLIVTQATRNDAPTAQGCCVGETTQQVNAVSPIALHDGKIMVQTRDGVALLRAATLQPL
jgi:hypothetical protein